MHLSVSFGMLILFKDAQLNYLQFLSIIVSCYKLCIWSVKDSLVYRCITSFDPVVFFIFRQNASVPRCVFSLIIMDLGDCHIFIPDL